MHIIKKVCKKERVTIKELTSGIRRKDVSRIRAQIAIGLVKKYGIALAEVARQVGVTTSARSKIMLRANHQVNLVNYVYIKEVKLNTATSPLNPICFSFH